MILHVGWFDPASAGWNMSQAVNAATDVRSRTCFRDFNHVSTQADIKGFEEEAAAAVEEADIVVFHCGVWCEEQTFGAIGPDFENDIQHHPVFAKAWTPEKAVVWLNGSRSLRKNVGAFRKRYEGFRVCATNQDIAELYGALWMPCCIDEWLDAKAASSVPLWTLRHEELVKRGKLLVAHPVTDLGVKSIDVIEAACKGSGVATRQMIGSLPWGEAMTVRLGMDVCFDHVNGYFGVTSIESAAAGMPNICWVPKARRDVILDRYGGARLPWILARDRYALGVALSALNQRHEDLVEWGAYAWRWYRRHFTNAIKAREFVAWLEGSAWKP